MLKRLVMVLSLGACAVCVLVLARCGGSTPASIAQPAAPAPVLNALTPNSGIAGMLGTGSFKVTLTGSGFTPNSTVGLSSTAGGGAQYPNVNFVDTSTLQISFPVALATPGTIQVAVVNMGSETSPWSNPLSFTVQPNPTPLVSSFAPATAMLGTGDFTLTINGQNFVPTSTVQWVGPTGTLTPAPGYISQSQLTVPIPASAITTMGNATVTVTNPGTGGTGGGSANAAFPIGTGLISVAITPTSPSLAAGTTLQLTATGTYANGSTRDLTSSVAWDSSDKTIATINPSGRLTALLTGTTSVTAVCAATTCNANSGSISAPAMAATVTSAFLAKLSIAPNNPSIPKGKTQPFTATGLFSDNTQQDLTADAKWSSSSPGVASIDQAGVATGLATGTTTINATDSANGNSQSAQTTLTISAAQLVSIAVDSTPTSGVQNIPLGTLLQLKATATYTDGSTLDLTSSVAWSSDNTAVATISTAGVVTSKTQGSVNLTAAQGQVSSTAYPLTVSAAVPQSIAVTPANQSVPLGRTVQFKATCTYTDQTQMDITTAADWSSSYPNVATISVAAGSEGLATTNPSNNQTTGTTTIAATPKGLTTPKGQTNLTVTAAVLDSIAISAPGSSITKGTTLQFTATGTYSDGSTVDLTSDRATSWSSSDTAIVSISKTGVATGVATGSVTITAKSGTVTSPALGLTVTAAALQSIAVSPSSTSSPVGTTQQFTATGTFTDGPHDITTAVGWSSSDLTVATISTQSGSQGLATAVKSGSTTITATDSATSKTGTATLTVTDAVLTKIDVTPVNPSIALGLTQQFTAIGSYNNGTTQNLTTTVIWSTKDANVAIISNAAGIEGVATSSGAGSTPIIATSGSVSGQATLTVTAAVLQSITVSPSSASIPVGLTQQFTASGTFTNGTRDITSSVQWSSDNAAVATISNQGLATAAKSGSVTITAALSGKTATATLTVTDPALTKIEVTPANPSIPLGLTKQFTATGTYDNNTTKDLTATVTWSSSNTSVADVSNTAGAQGLATSHNKGSAAIIATLGTVNGQTTLTVTDPSLLSIAVSPASAAVNVGGTQPFTAKGTYSDNSSRDLTSSVIWNSSDTGIATIDATGTATGVAPGTVSITASVGTIISGPATLTVNGA